MLDIFNNTLKSICVLAGIFCIGLCGGLIAGFIILSFGFYIGKSGSTGNEYIGFWDPEYALWLASWIGAPIGGISFLVAYYAMLRGISWGRILIATLSGTVLGGGIGAFNNLWVAAMLGVAGFWTACFMLFDLYQENTRPEHQ